VRPVLADRTPGRQAKGYEYTELSRKRDITIELRAPGFVA